MNRGRRAALRALLVAGTFVPLTVGAVSLVSQMQGEQRRVSWMAITGQPHPDAGKDDSKSLRAVLFIVSAVFGFVGASYEFASREGGTRTDTYSIRSFSEHVKDLYRENDFPSERLIREPSALAGFTAKLNARTKQEFSCEVVAAELERIRKGKRRTGGLPKLGRSFHGPHFKTQDWK